MTPTCQCSPPRRPFPNGTCPDCRLPIMREASPSTKIIDDPEASAELARACRLVVENLEFYEARGYDDLNMTPDDLLSGAEEAHRQLGVFIKQQRGW